MNSEILKSNFNTSGHIDQLSTNKHQGCYLSGLPQQDVLKVFLDSGQELVDGRFVIKNEIGSGKLCVVYLAYDQQRKEDVALKIACCPPVDNNNIEQLFINEFRINTFVKDKRYVLQLHEYHRCMHDGALLAILSMEYADGGSFRGWLDSNKYNLEMRYQQGLMIFRHVCAGVGALHENNVCHLDLKPENVLFVKGMIKVSDFGLSSLRYDAIQNGIETISMPPDVTTAEYMSPEQFVAPHIMNIDARSDIYMLSVMLFEILHPECKTPFEGNYEFQRFQHLQVPAPDVITHNETIRRVIMKGLQKNPADRYSNIAELILALDGRPAEQNVMLEEEVDEPEDNSDVVNELWNEVLAKINEPDFNKAIILCNRIFQLDPDHTKAVAAFGELKERFEKASQFYSAIDNGIATEPMDHLVELLCEAISLYPNHPNGHLIQVQLSSKSREYAETMERRLVSARRNSHPQRPRINRTPTPINIYSGSNNNSSRRATHPFRVSTRRWYHRLWDSIRDFFSG